MNVEIRHLHLFCGLGGGARGFNRGQARAGESFVLSATPLWLRQLAVALTVEGGRA